MMFSFRMCHVFWDEEFVGLGVCLRRVAWVVGGMVGFSKAQSSRFVCFRFVSVLFKVGLFRMLYLLFWGFRARSVVRGFHVCSCGQGLGLMRFRV